MKPSLPSTAGRSLRHATTCLPLRPKPLRPASAPNRPKPFKRSSFDWVMLQSNAEASNLHVTAAPGCRMPKHPTPHAAYRRDQPAAEATACIALRRGNLERLPNLPAAEATDRSDQHRRTSTPPKRHFCTYLTLGPPKQPSRRNISFRRPKPVKLDEASVDRR